ncbi:CRAL/TRIO domain containing protein [Novymonas esmeraldas]|uniref:CRAL/TRIO domain containing protein n=1 Tax=Novymonas esmeraldas TaxID=1808958 RepID=A0AAW0EXN1_9TRYP
MSHVGEDARSEDVAEEVAQPTTVPLTPAQAGKIRALIRLMTEHYDPLPAQVQTYLQLMPSAPTASPGGGEEEADEEAAPPHPERSPLWFYCSCFLVSREWDVERAFAMMQDVVAYRAANHLDEQSFFPTAVPVRGWAAADVCERLHKPPREVGQRADRVCAAVAQGVTCGLHYWDKSGRPVVYVVINSLDEVELMRQLRQMASVGASPSTVMWEFSQHFLGVTEALVLYQLIQREMQRSRRSSTATASAPAGDAAPAPGLSQGVVTLVFDMKGLSMRMLWKPLLDLFRDVAKEFFKYYPDIVHRIICVNSPSLVRYAFRLVRGVMPATFQRKISFVSPHHTLSTLATVIDTAHIPHFLGGQCRCAGEEGGCLGGYDPQHPRRTAAAAGRGAGGDADHEKDTAEARTEDVTLAAGHECARVFHVSASEVVTWEFAVVGGGHDITFTCFFVPHSAAAAMRWSKVEPKKLGSYTVTSEAVAESCDVFVAAEDGVVVLGWRNTRSWFASKRMQLRAYKETPPCPSHEEESRSDSPSSLAAQR